jgi:flagellar biosynthesis protein FliP
MARPRIVGLRFAAAAFVLAAATIPAAAQDISVTFGSGTGLTERVLQLVALVTVLSLAPSILIMVTSFTRIVVVLCCCVPRSAPPPRRPTPGSFRSRCSSPPS